MYTDILDVTKGILCQQVNCKGIMGAGLALSIRRKWSAVYKAYKDNYRRAELGQIQPVCINNDLYIVNFFAQDRYGRDKQYTDYMAFTSCLLKTKKWASQHCPDLDIYLPYKIGCSLAGGDWNIVEELITTIIPSATIIKKEN